MLKEIEAERGRSLSSTATLLDRKSTGMRYSERLRGGVGGRD